MHQAPFPNGPWAPGQPCVLPTSQGHSPKDSGGAKGPGVHLPCGRTAPGNPWDKACRGYPPVTPKAGCSPQLLIIPVVTLEIGHHGLGRTVGESRGWGQRSRDGAAKISKVFSIEALFCKVPCFKGLMLSMLHPSPHVIREFQSK